MRVALRGVVSVLHGGIWRWTERREDEKKINGSRKSMRLPSAALPGRPASLRLSCGWFFLFADMVPRTGQKEGKKVGMNLPCFQSEFIYSFNDDGGRRTIKMLDERVYVCM